jgi:hypothetical protein
MIAFVYANIVKKPAMIAVRPAMIVELTTNICDYPPLKTKHHEKQRFQ